MYSQRKALKWLIFANAHKAIAFGFDKMDPSQNVDLNIPLERALKELLNALFSFDESHS